MCSKTYQIKVCAIGVTVGIRCVHSQGHTIGKDGQQNQVLKWSDNFVKEDIINFNKNLFCIPICYIVIQFMLH